MADESGSGKATVLDRVKKREENIENLLYRDPDESPSFYRQWTWGEALANPLEFIRSASMRMGDKPTKENVEESMATGGPASSGALGNFGAVLRPFGNTPLQLGQSQDLLRVARKFYPDITDALDALPDIVVQRQAKLDPGVLGYYTPPENLISPLLKGQGTSPTGRTPGGKIDVGILNKRIVDELDTLAHEGHHAQATHSPRAVPNTHDITLPNVSDKEMLDLLADYIQTGDISMDLVKKYANISPRYGMRHALIEAEAKRAVRELWPHGLDFNASQADLESILEFRAKHAVPNKTSNPLGIITNPQSSRWLKP